MEFLAYLDVKAPLAVTKGRGDTLRGGESDDWSEGPVLAGICPKCGKMELHLATSRQFKQWLDSETKKARGAGG